MDNNKTKLLVVDDLEEVREYVKSYFTRRDYFVFTADSAEQSLPIIKEQNPEIMFLDVNLPKMNGIDLVRLIRQFNKIIKVVIVSGSAFDFRNDPQIKELDILEFLHKPISFDELESVIKKVLALAK